jgi:hypothetical protein
VITDPAEISGGQVIRDPAFDNGCDPDAQAGATVLSREISVPDTTVTETTAAPLTTGAVSTEGTAPAAPRPKVTLAPRPTPAPPPTPPPTVAPAPPTPPTPPPTPSVTQPTVTVTTAKVIVPNLLQLDRDDAEALLARLGLKANVLRVDLKFNDSRVGFVVSQLPEAGSAVDPDSLVTVGVGNPGPVLVPNVMGLVRSEAEKVIKDAGLTSKVSLEGDDAGRVVKQDPAGDTFLPPQGLVTLTLEANSVE